MLPDLPADFKSQRAYLQFVRGQNNIMTKKAYIDEGGFVEFNEKIEMKTLIEANSETGGYVDKKANIQACLSDGRVLGTSEFNLADYAKPNQYLKQLTLVNTIPGVSAKSFINVEVKTSDGSGGAPAAGDNSSPNKLLNKNSRQSVIAFQPNIQTNKLIKQYQT